MVYQMSASAKFVPSRSQVSFWSQIGVPPRGRKLYEAIEAGFDFATYQKLATATGVEKKELARITNIKSATLSRRAKDGKFSSDESDRLYRYAEVYNASLRLFENNKIKAFQWMHNPVKALGFVAPSDMLKTSAETEEVLSVIGRLEHGVFN